VILMYFLPSRSQPFGPSKPPQFPVFLSATSELKFYAISSFF